MDLNALNWKSFWDIATPERTAMVLFEMYGNGAVAAVTDCADQARRDGREADLHYWDMVAVMLIRHLPALLH